MYSKEFGQHEELITRINRILSGYPCDAGILKELVQNADDAKANEVHIVLVFTPKGTAMSGEMLGCVKSIASVELISISSKHSL
jgi:hypothetical protein